jgi:proteic killer suppression protein
MLIIAAAIARAVLRVHRDALYVFAVIRSWRNAASRKVWEGEQPNQFRGLAFDAAIDLLLALNVAKSLHELSPLKSVGLHKLKGEREGQWAMTVAGRWRICFEFQRGDAYNVEVVDYHKG